MRAFLGVLLAALLLGFVWLLSRGARWLVSSRTGRWVLIGVALWVFWKTGVLEQLLPSIITLALIYLGFRVMLVPFFGRGRRRGR